MATELSSITAFILFALVASITPGPTNILILSNSSSYGFQKTFPLIIGASSGAALIVLLAGVGLGSTVLQYPLVKDLMAWGGALWLTALGWKIFNLRAITETNQRSSQLAGWKVGAGMQAVNPKTWMMALAVSSVFTSAAGSSSQVIWYALIFFLIAMPCLICWAALGIGSNRLLKSDMQKELMNKALAVLLLVSVWWAMGIELMAGQ